MPALDPFDIPMDTHLQPQERPDPGFYAQRGQQPPRWLHDKAAELSAQQTAAEHVLQQELAAHPNDPGHASVVAAQARVQAATKAYDDVADKIYPRAAETKISQWSAPSALASAEKSAALVYAKQEIDRVKEGIDSKASDIVSGKSTAAEGPKTNPKALKDTQQSIAVVRSLANDPAKLAAAVEQHLGDLPNHAPATAAESAKTMTTAVQYLAHEAPPPAVPPNPLDPEPAPSKLDLLKWQAKAAAVRDPIGALHSAYDQQAVWQTITSVYPSLAAQVSASLAASLQPGPRLTFQGVQRASAYMGVPAVPSLTSSAIAAYQSAYIEQKTQIPQAPKKARTSKAGIGKSQFGERAATPLESAEGAFSHS